MEIETYWPQEKLLFIATCALFPDRILDNPLQPDPLSSILSVPDEQLEKLNEYASEKMLEFVIGQDNIGSTQYSIKKVDQSKFHEMMINYLEKFRNDELLAKPSEKPEQYKELQGKLYQYLLHSNRLKPIVNPYNIWPDWYKGYGNIRPFWEIVLSSSELSPKTTRTINIGYQEVETTGFGENPPASFAEIEIIDNKLLTVALEINPSSNQVSKHGTFTSQVIIDIEDKVLYALIDRGKKKIPIKRFRTDSPLFNFMHYLKINHDKDIVRGIIQTKVEGCASKKDMTEVVRRCGFTRDLEPLKEVFFPGTTNEKVHFRPTYNLKRHQIDLLINHIAK